MGVTLHAVYKQVRTIQTHRTAFIPEGYHPEVVLDYC